MSYFDFTKTLIDDDNVAYSGVAQTPDFSIYEDNFKLKVIQAEEQYRPDKIAWKLWNDGDLAWVLDEINNFDGSCQNYETNKTIKYLEKTYLEKLGIF